MDVTLGKLILMADLIYSLDVILGKLILMADLLYLLGGPFGQTYYNGLLYWGCVCILFITTACIVQYGIPNSVVH